MAEFRENVIEWLNGQERVTLTLSQRRHIHRIQKYNKKFPDEVVIQHVNEDGTILASMPLSYLKISRPREFTEEQKHNSAENFRELRSSGKLKGSKVADGENT